MNIQPDRERAHAFTQTPSEQKSVMLSQIGKKVHLWEAGSMNMPVVLLVHGGFGNASTLWQQALHVLGKQFHVYAPDLPGVGASEPLEAPSFAHLIQWLSSLQHQLAVRQLTIVGSSFGGLLSRFYAASYPELVERLVLVNGGEIAPPPAFARLLLSLPGVSSLLMDHIRRQNYSSTGLQRAIFQKSILTNDFVHHIWATSTSFLNITRNCLRQQWPTLHTPHCPTLVLWGAQDQLVPPQTGQTLAQELSRAQFVEIEKAGHLPMLEQPELFHQALLTFLHQYLATDV